MINLFRKLFKKKDDSMCGYFWFSKKQNDVSTNSRATFARIGFRTVEYSEWTMRDKPAGLWDDYVRLGYGRFSHAEKRARRWNSC